MFYEKRKKIKKYSLVKYFVLILIIISLSSILSGKSNNTVVGKSQEKTIISEYEIKLWKNTVEDYYGADLWRDEYIYDAGHFLMVPLHAAFNSGNKKWISQFDEFIDRFLIAYRDNQMSDRRLNRLQFFYFLSQYIVLLEQRGCDIPKILPTRLYEEIKDYWTKMPAWQWGRKDFENGIMERVIWKLNIDNCKRSFYKAIIDEELFLFAIAADLLTYYILSNEKFGKIEVLEDIYNIAKKVFQRRVIWNNNGGWIFQPGVWKDHGNYRYAGQYKKEEGVEEITIDGIAPDSSHGIRFPLWLSSLSQAGESKKDKSFYKKLKSGLNNQFFNNVLIPPTEDFPSYRTTNYMDGRNGLYRGDYQTCPDDGYGPYELSGTLMIG